MKKFWCAFFVFWPVVAIVACWMSPAMGWWFPGSAQGTGWESPNPLGREIDNLFYLILVIVAVVFVATQAALGYVLWMGATKKSDEKALFTHGNHNLEVIWTIVPAGILLFVALYQMDVWAQFRVKSTFERRAVLNPIAEVTARQFEWRIRYPARHLTFESERDVQRWLREPHPKDLYSVNDLRVPTNRKVLIHLKTEDVQHAFFVPVLRVKQDAVPGKIIPIWFEAERPEKYELVCAELCGWGHYKMKAQVWAQPVEDYEDYLAELERAQFDDGVSDPAGGE